MKQLFGAALSLFLIPTLIFGKKSYQPSDQNLLSRKLFQDSKFGFFIHCGPLYNLEIADEISIFNAFCCLLNSYRCDNQKSGLAEDDLNYVKKEFLNKIFLSEVKEDPFNMHYSIKNCFFLESSYQPF